MDIKTHDITVLSVEVTAVMIKDERNEIRIPIDDIIKFEVL